MIAVAVARIMAFIRLPAWRVCPGAGQRLPRAPMWSIDDIDSPQSGEVRANDVGQAFPEDCGFPRVKIRADRLAGQLVKGGQNHHSNATDDMVQRRAALT